MPLLHLLHCRISVTSIGINCSTFSRQQPCNSCEIQSKYFQKHFDSISKSGQLESQSHRHRQGNEYATKCGNNIYEFTCFGPWIWICLSAPSQHVLRPASALVLGTKAKYYCGINWLLNGPAQPSWGPSTRRRMGGNFAILSVHFICIFQVVGPVAIQCLPGN